MTRIPWWLCSTKRSSTTTASEAAILLRPSRDGVATLLSEIDQGRLEILPLSAADVRPVQAILDRFHDQRLDLADACLMHLAEREGMRHIFTLDHRHFSVLRTSVDIGWRSAATPSRAVTGYA